MNARRLTIAIVSGSLALSFPAAIAATGTAATSGDNLQQAILQTQQAIQAGEQNDASSLVQHADNAIDSAMMAAKDNKNRKIKAGVQLLRAAVRTTQGTHFQRRVQAATRRAQTALSYFQSAQQR